MAFNREQLRAYWAANKAILNAKRREKRRLAKLKQVNQASDRSFSLEMESSQPTKLSLKISRL